MSSVKRVATQKSGPQGAEGVAYQSDVSPVVLPVLEKGDAIAESSKEVTPMQDEQSVANVLATDLPVDLVAIAEEFHAESVAISYENSGGEVLLAQAASSKSDTGVLFEGDGLSTAGWAAVAGLGLIAVAAAGGSSDSNSSTSGGNINLPGGNYTYSKSPGANNFTFALGDFDVDGISLKDDLRIDYYSATNVPSETPFYLYNLIDGQTFSVEGTTFSVTQTGGTFKINNQEVTPA